MHSRLTSWHGTRPWVKLSAPTISCFLSETFGGGSVSRVGRSRHAPERLGDLGCSLTCSSANNCGSSLAAWTTTTLDFLRLGFSAPFGTSSPLNRILITNNVGILKPFISEQGRVCAYSPQHQLVADPERFCLAFCSRTHLILSLPPNMPSVMQDPSMRRPPCKIRSMASSTTL